MNKGSEQLPSVKDLCPKMQELLGIKKYTKQLKNVVIEKNYTRLRALLCLQDFTEYSWINKGSLRNLLAKVGGTEHILDLINKELEKYEKEEKEEKQQKILETIERIYLEPAFKNAVKNGSLIDKYYGKDRDTIPFQGKIYPFNPESIGSSKVSNWEYDKTYKFEKRRFGPGVTDSQTDQDQIDETQNILGIYIMEVMNRWKGLIGFEEIVEEEVKEGKKHSVLQVSHTVGERKEKEPKAKKAKGKKCLGYSKKKITT